MRKTTKGAIAVGAGVALLLGGAGTLAAWRVSAGVGPGTSDHRPASFGVAKIGATGRRSGRWTNGATPRYERELADRPGRLGDPHDRCSR